jgi:trans-aconitate methyltransferase
MDLKEAGLLAESAETHWYYQSKAAAVSYYTRSLPIAGILDIGAGSGFFTRYLLQRTPASVGICVDTGYPCDWDEVFYGKPLHFRRVCAEVGANLVLLMDVLEHVDDDSALLAQYAAKVASGARFVITVPAFKWLWSEHDVFLEHRRRYRMEELVTAVAKAGLTVLHSSYFFGLVLPLAAATRLPSRLHRQPQRPARSQLRKHGWLTNTTLSALCRLELPFLRFNRLGGLSVFCLAAKP